MRSAQIHGKLCTCKHEYSSNILFNLKLTSPSPLLLRSCTVKDGQRLDFACQTCIKRCNSDKKAFEKRNWAMASRSDGLSTTLKFQTREDHFTVITSRCCVRKCKRSYDPDYKEKGYCRYGCPERKLCRKCYSQLSKVDFQFEKAELEEKEFHCQHCSACFEYEEDRVNHVALFHTDGNDSKADREQTEVCCDDCDDWVCCDGCDKWSVLPDGISSNDLPDEWYCNACKKQE